MVRPVWMMEYNDILDLFGTTFYGNKPLNIFLKQKRKEKKPLTNFLILPVQRVPRYILLLKELINFRFYLNIQKIDKNRQI